LSARLPSSAAKRLQYTMSPGSEKVSGSMLHDVLQSVTQTPSSVTQRRPRGDTNGASNCSGSDRTSEFDSKFMEVFRSPKVTSRSPKIINKSPKVTNGSPEVNGSPGRRQPINGSGLKRGRLESPAGQPRTKKFIVERLRNAKTSRKKLGDILAGNKSSPGRKSPQKKYIGKLYLSYICTVVKVQN